MDKFNRGPHVSWDPLKGSILKCKEEKDEQKSDAQKRRARSLPASTLVLSSWGEKIPLWLFINQGALTKALIHIHTIGVAWKTPEYLF